MAGKAGILNVIIGAKIGEFLTKMQVVEKKTKKTQRNTSNWLAKNKAMIGAAVGGIAIAAVNAAAKFEKSMLKMQTMVGLTADEVGSFEGKIKSLAVQTGISSIELADAMFFITSAGLRGADALEALEFSAKSAAIGMGQTENVADALTSVMNAYGTETISAAQASEILWKTVKNGKIVADELAGAIGSVIPLSSEMGVSFAEVSGAISTMSLTGATASEAVTRLRGILSASLKETSKGAKALSGSGGLIDSYDTLRKSIREKGLLKTLGQLKEDFGGNEAALTAFLGKQEAILGFLSLTGKGWEQYGKFVADAEEKTSNLNKALDIYAQSKSKRIVAAQERINQLLQWGGNELVEFADNIIALGTGEANTAYKDLIANTLTAYGATKKLKEEALLMWKATLNPPTEQKQPTGLGLVGFGQTGDGGAARNALLLDREKKAREANIKAIQAEMKANKAIEPLMLKSLETRIGLALGIEEQTTKTNALTRAISDNTQVVNENEATISDLEASLIGTGLAASEFATTFLDEWSFAFDFVAGSLSRLDSVFSQFHQNRMDDLTALEKREIDSYNARMQGAMGYQEGLASLQEQQGLRRDKAQKEFAEKQKKLAMFQAIILGAQAVLQALASVPFPYNIAAAVVTGGIAGLEVAAISGAAFAGGGISFTGGQALVGERGAEMVNLPAGARISNASATSAMGGDLRAEFDREKMILWTAKGSRHHSFRRAGI